MDQLILALVLLGVGHVSADTKVIVPHRVKEGDQIYVACDADLAGVPTTALGMNKLEVIWGSNVTLLEVFGYSNENGKLEIRDPSKPRKYFEPFGHTSLNSNDWLKRDEFRLVIKAQNANVKDSGRVCCEGLYFDVFRKIEASSQCVDMRVGNTAIVHPGSTSAGNAVKVLCNAELAGISEPTNGLTSLMLNWNNGRSAAFFEIKPNPSNINKADTNKNAPGRAGDWTFAKNVVLMQRIAERFEGGSTTIGLDISSAQAGDSGLFCCDSTYFTKTGQTGHSIRCHNLIVGSGLSYSTNAGPSVRVSYGTVFAVLVWMMMQLYFTS